VTQAEALNLTPRQCDVLLLLERGEHIADVADILSIEILTVRSHLRDIHCKLNVSRWPDAVREARRLNLLPPNHETRITPHRRRRSLSRKDT